MKEITDDVVRLTAESSEVQVCIPGYAKLFNKKSKRNRALTLKAMANLEYRHIVDKGPDGKKMPTGTKEDILAEVRRLGGTLGEKSGYQVLKNIKALIDQGHVVYRGGGRTPWVTVYVYPAFSEQ